MANDFSGRIWKITAAGTTTEGTANVKIRGGVWTGGTAADTFIVTDVAGRAYTWTYPASGDALNFQELGWLSAPLTFSGTFHGEINWYLGSK
jgi:hypothetical protein